MHNAYCDMTLAIRKVTDLHTLRSRHGHDKLRKISVYIVIKITASHDFLGGLAAFIFTAGCRLAAIFSASGRLI